MRWYMVLVKKLIWFCCFDLWLLITAINKPHLIDRKDEADGYKGAIQTEWPKFYSIRRSHYCNGVKHGEILKQQADHVKLLGHRFDNVHKTKICLYWCLVLMYGSLESLCYRLLNSKCVLVKTEYGFQMRTYVYVWSVLK